MPNALDHCPSRLLDKFFYDPARNVNPLLAAFQVFPGKEMRGDSRVCFGYLLHQAQKLAERGKCCEVKDASSWRALSLGSVLTGREDRFRPSLSSPRLSLPVVPHKAVAEVSK